MLLYTICLVCSSLLKIISAIPFPICALTLFCCTFKAFSNYSKAETKAFYFKCTSP